MDAGCSTEAIIQTPRHRPAERFALWPQLYTCSTKSLYFYIFFFFLFFLFVLELTDKDIVGQCVQFFFAGFDTIATALALTANQLAENPEAQAKLIKEIDAHSEALEKDQEIDYEFIRNLKYLEMVLSGKNTFLFFVNSSYKGSTIGFYNFKYY